MKILHTADWHIGNFPGPEKDGVNLRAQDTGNCINHLNDIALLERPDIIVISATYSTRQEYGRTEVCQKLQLQ